MVGETKISELGLLSSLNGTELIPAIQDQSGTWVNGSLTISNLGQMTEAEMNAIASPAVGLEVFNTTRDSKMFYHSFFGWTPVSVLWNSWWGYIFRSEMMATNSDPWVITTVNGGKVFNTLLTNIFPTSAHSLSTGVTSNGESRINTNSYILGSTGKKRTEVKIVMSNLSTSIERYTYYFGYVSTPTVLNQPNGMFFLYDEGGLSAGSTASPNWQCVCCSGGSRTFVDSGVAVKDVSLNQAQNLRIDDDGTGASLKFYIDGSLVATITTNIPTSSSQLVNIARIAKITGTSQCAVHIDYIEMKEKFNSPR